jgi:hypothetical protein
LDALCVKWFMYMLCTVLPDKFLCAWHMHMNSSYLIPSNVLKFSLIMEYEQRFSIVE